MSLINLLSSEQVPAPIPGLDPLVQQAINNVMSYIRNSFQYFTGSIIYQTIQQELGQTLELSTSDPASLQLSQLADSGSSPKVSRSDHVHELVTGTAAEISNIGLYYSLGVSVGLAPVDHQHNLLTTFPITFDAYDNLELLYDNSTIGVASNELVVLSGSGSGPAYPSASTASEQWICVATAGGLCIDVNSSTGYLSTNPLAVKIGSGLTDDGSGNIKINLSSSGFLDSPTLAVRIGTGLESDGSNNIKVSDYAGLPTPSNPTTTDYGIIWNHTIPGWELIETDENC